MIGVLANLGSELADLNRLMRLELERKEAEDERKRRKHEQMECEYLEAERVRAEQRGKVDDDDNPMVEAIIQLERVDDDLSPDEQAFLIDLFQDWDIATAYLAIRSRSLRRAWIGYCVTVTI